MESKVTIIMQEMLPLLNNEQLLALRESLEHHLVDGKSSRSIRIITCCNYLLPPSR